MKCLPQNKILQAQGVVLHDWHAEVLAIRSFNRFLLDECRALAAAEKTTSEFIRVRSENERTEACFQPFALKDDIYLHMYCSEAPCKTTLIGISNDTKSLSSCSGLCTDGVRRRRKYGTYHGCAGRPNAMAHSNILIRYPNDLVPRASSSWEILFLDARYRPSQAFTIRCTPNTLKILLRQTCSQAGHFSALVCNIASDLAA